MWNEKACRRLAYASSGVAFAINLAILFLIQLLPESSSQVSHHVFIYAAFSTSMSLAGLLGAYKRNATWISVFVNYLLLDAVVFTVPRLLLLTYATTIPHDFCSRPAGDFSTDQIAFRTSPAYAQHQMRRIEKVEAWASGLAELSPGRCLGVSWALVALLSVAVLGLTLGQWVAAFKVRRYSRHILQELELPAEMGDHEDSEYLDWRAKSPVLRSAV